MAKQAPAKPADEDLPFEVALERLEALVDRLEGGELDLETSLREFESGVRLVRHCSERLQAAELRIRQLEASAEGAEERDLALEEERVSDVFDVAAFLERSRACVDAALDRALPPASEPPEALHEAMRYAVFSGGKRLRPALAFGAARACGAHESDAIPAAVAVELVHAYSLAHDDLPAMDDDDERRGRPSVHVKFGEANAILVGDALLPLAFEVLAEAGAPLAVAGRLARAAGSRALVGGQADDLTLRAPSAAVVERIHRRKTSALFSFAVAGAAEAVGAPAEAVERLDAFGLEYGLMFQAVDDLADADPDECSILNVLPRQEVCSRVHACAERACEALEPLGAAAEALRALVDQLVGRVPWEPA